MSTLGEKLKKITALDKHRERERKRMDGLLQEKQRIENEISELEVVLESLDEQLEALEEQCLPGGEESIDVKQEPASSTTNSCGNHRKQLQQQQQDEDLSPSINGTQSMSIHHSDEQLTDPATQSQFFPTVARKNGHGPGRVSLDTQLTEPSSQLLTQIDDYNEIGNGTQFNNIPSNGSSSGNNKTGYPRPAVSNSSVRQLEIVTVPPKKKKAPTATAGNPVDNFRATSLDTFPSFVPPVAARASSSAATTPTTINAMASVAAHPQSYASTNEYSRSDFSWSAQIQDLLQNSFRIQQFREHQKEVINATLAKRDVFVLMRTGGGKSLTYQLPALFEGRGRGQSCKITLVISPLLSLIKDQEDQMNQFAPGSAVSFTSNLSGGQSEHTRRWNLVRDPQQGVCMILVTPEKVHKSGKLKSELQKLHSQNRLGRFVIDEAHCCSVWGHDYRPDYTKLGILRMHFPNIPILAVTATASDRVRDDVCEILHINHDCVFFRSTANRPNLSYEVRNKRTSGSGDTVLDDMAAFIKEEFPRGAGIIYTFSRKDADTVADKLCDRGIVAQSYHSDVSPADKDMIHQSWMRNHTQVVVATIAFGLGINKPDVRFVLHHTISKTLEAYYQESGRAGRDGKPAKCVLYYSPKDVPRMIKMVHGDSRGAMPAFWQMVRYAQESGGDAVCRAIILAALGEQDIVDIKTARQQGENSAFCERRDVGKHAKTVTQLLKTKTSHGENVTLNMLVKDWRAKAALPCVAENPPGNDLNLDECERLIIGLLVENIFQNSIVWNAYDSVVYLTMGKLANSLLASRDPKVEMTFPKREKASRKSTLETKKKASVKTVANEDGWIARSASKKNGRKLSSTGTKKAVSNSATASKKRKALETKKKAKPRKKATNKKPDLVLSEEVIELSDDDEDEPAVRASRPRAAKSATVAPNDELWDESPDTSGAEDEEYEFDG